MRIRVLRTLLAAAAAVAVLVPATSAQPPARARADAAVATGSLGDVAAVTASGDAQRRHSLPARVPAGLSLGSGEASASAARSGGDATARADAVARSVELLGGLVTAYGVRRSALDAGTGVRYDGMVRGLKIQGRLIGDVDRPARFDLGGAGAVVVNRGAAGLRVTLTQPLGGYPAGTAVTVAEVSATARDGAAPSPTATPTATATATRTATPAAKAAHRHAPPKPDPVKRLSEEAGFTFPVAGRTVIGGPFGAARPGGMVHQGNDLFADFGTPVVAVADGTVGRVGTLPVSGNRLWVTTARGDGFFYAHLSAFSADAVDGAQVKNGTVLGYVGNTGDAEPTPPHLHFEIHPGGGPAIDPHRILVAWQRRAGTPEPDTAQRPGALVEVHDFIAGG